MKRHLLIALASFVVSFFLFAFFFLALPEIADGDSYYHLGIARSFAADGIGDDFPWARYSVMHRGFGDKELLFHLLLVPFVAAGEPEEMGRLALAFLNAIVVACIAGLATRAVGLWGLAAAPLLYLASPAFFSRAIRLRPELWALILLIAFVWLAARKRVLVLAVIAALFALSYTAIHALVGLCVILLAVDFLYERRFDWKMLASVVGGAVLGLLVHPHFPHNLEIWWVQNVLFFLHKSALDVGNEILSPRVVDVLLGNGVLALALIATWVTVKGRRLTTETQRTQSETETPPEDMDRPARYFTVAAIVFGMLYCLMSRMSTYFVPLALLAVLFAMARRGMKPRGVVVAAASMVAIAAASLHPSALFAHFQRAGEPHRIEADFAALGKAIPPGAKVIADWRLGETLVLYAPQGRYLNVLDPVFMAVADPQRHRTLYELLAGDHPDPAAAARFLDSDYIAFDRHEHPALERRLVGDPRVRPIYVGRTFLGRIVPAPAFLPDWNGYVDLSTQTGPFNSRAEDRCVAVMHPLVVRPPTTYMVEFAPYGPGSLWLDQTLAVSIAGGEGRAIPGEGASVPLHLTAGWHSIRVETCRTTDSGPRGFYLLIRRKGNG